MATDWEEDGWEEDDLTEEEEDWWYARMGKSVPVQDLETLRKGILFGHSDFRGSSLTNQDMSGIGINGESIPDSDLSHSNLKGADLRGEFLGVRAVGADFSDASFGRGAKMSECNFEGAIFDRAKFASTHFSRCNLHGVRFTDAKMKRVRVPGSLMDRDAIASAYSAGLRYFNGVDASDIDLGGLDLSSSKFNEADLDGADFSGASLKDVEFVKTNLWEARFVGADLQRSRFSAANAENANFSDADARETDWTGSHRGGSYGPAKLKNASFQGADLRSAQFPDRTLGDLDLSEARLSPAMLTKWQAVYDGFGDEAGVAREFTEAAQWANPKKAPEWKRLLNRSQKLWETYDAKPLKKNLLAFGTHIEKMKASSSLKVKTEARSAARAFNAELKERGWKR